jgi:hypothetical protein
MRDFTKSMMSYSWAQSMFSLQQMLNLLTPQGRDPTAKVTEAFNNVTAAVVEQLGDTMKETFRIGDRMQQEMVDMMLGNFGLGALDPTRWMKMGSSVIQQSAEAAKKVAGGTATGAPTAGGPAADGGTGPSSSASQPEGWGPMPQ